MCVGEANVSELETVDVGFRFRQLPGFASIR